MKADRPPARGRRPGPTKQFDPDQALLAARDLFWRHGYDGTGIRQLEEGLGIGRKSLYDTFGSKRELFHAALERYGRTVIQRICDSLRDDARDGWSNLERVLDRLYRHHASDDSLGCLLGVSMAQAQSDDVELATRVAGSLLELERAFEHALRRASDEGALRTGTRPKDAARNLVALTQGLALMGRVDSSQARMRSVVRAALDGLRA